ncbi:hypothetical protein AAIH32_08790 [Pseudarthrobacter oxydans]|uniref:hypothetical protein n=1 Tax=Pseudarthrobacter oxydans TaxID=1671 RepID=UPI003D2D1581
MTDSQELRQANMPNRLLSGKASLPFLLLVSVVMISMAFIAWSVMGRASVAAAPVFSWLINLGITVFVACAAWSQCIDSSRQGLSPSRIGSAVFAPLVLMAVTLPAASLVWRTRTANVEKLTRTELATPDALSFSLLLFTACLLAFWLGEGLLRPKQNVTWVQITDLGLRWRRAQLLLILVGLASSASQLGGDRTVEFSERGTQEGQGILVLAWWCLPLGIAIGFLFRHWESKPRLFVSLVGIALIVNSGVRSPLLLIAIAFIPRLIATIARSPRPLKVWATAVFGSYLLIAVGGAISVWRGSIRYGSPVTFGQALYNAAADPLKALTSSGLDTVDGLLLVYSLPANIVDANLLDLFKAVQTAIPSQFYPDKPEFISNIISRELLGYGAAGMFMSGPGYLILIGGSWLTAVVFFFVGGVIFRCLTSRRVGGVAWLILTYTLIRFVMGGDAFDFYQGLTLVAISTAALVAAHFLDGVRGRMKVTKPSSDRKIGVSLD